MWIVHVLCIVQEDLPGERAVEMILQSNPMNANRLTLCRWCETEIIGYTYCGKGWVCATSGSLTMTCVQGFITTQLCS